MNCTVCGRSHGFHQLYTISGYALNQLFPSMVNSEFQEMVSEMPFHICTDCLFIVHVAV